MTGPSILKRGKSLIAELGVRDALAYKLDLLLLRLFGRRTLGGLVTYGLFTQAVQSPPAARRSRPPKPGGVAYPVFDSHSPLLETLGLGDALSHRTDQNAVCVGAEKDGRLIGAIWYVKGAYIEDEVRCRFVPLPEGEAAWDFGVHIDPEYRLSPVFARLWAATNRVMAERGVKWSCSRISAYNPQSVRSHERMGAKMVGKVRFLNLLGLQVMWGNIPPYFHLSLPGNSGPVLRVGPDRE